MPIPLFVEEPMVNDPVMQEEVGTEATVVDKAVVEVTVVEKPAGQEPVQDAHGIHWFHENGERIGMLVNDVVPF